MIGLVQTLYHNIPLKPIWIKLIRRLGRPWFYRRLRFDGPFRVDIDGGQSSFLLNNYEEHYGLETEFFWRGFEDAWESVSLAIWVELCRSSKCILDIGACEGVYALSAQAVAPTDALIKAFEPLPSAFEVLFRNCTLNGGRIDAHCVAISDREGTAEFYIDEGAALSTEGSLVKRDGQKSIVVEVSDLDSFLEQARVPPPDLIKIDVEGHEPSVFAGVSKTLAAYRPTIIVEVLSDEVAEKIEHYISRLRYAYFDINDDARFGKRLGVIQRKTLRKASCLNFLLIPEERLSTFSIERWQVDTFD